MARIAASKRLPLDEIERRLAARADDFVVNGFDYARYRSRSHDRIDVTCVRCQRTTPKTLQALERGALCKFCFPFTTSRGELDVGNFVASLLGDEGLVVRNDRSVIAPLELDVWVPSAKFAVEYNGLYWHMDKGDEGFDKRAHQTKTDRCAASGIRLFHVFSDEWETKRELVQSMIAARLGKSSRTLAARKCVVEELSAPVALREFFEASHISGYGRAGHGFTLKLDGETVAALTVRRPLSAAKYGDALELARFANARGTNVVGGFTRLLARAKAWAKERGFRRLVSYCDLRFGDGKVYATAGFTRLADTTPSYWYTDGVKRLDRFAYRAQGGLSEKVMAANAGVVKVYGCANAVYELGL